MLIENEVNCQKLSLSNEYQFQGCLTVVYTFFEKYLKIYYYDFSEMLMLMRVLALLSKKSMFVLKFLKF